MEENLPPSQVPVNPVPPVQPPPPKRFPLKQILVVVLVVGIFFAPIPFYVSGDRAVCLGIDICPRQGWNLGPSLWQRISGGFFLRQSVQPSSPLTPIPAPDPTANWKTYSDKQLTFRYPGDWTIDPIQVFGSRSEVEFKYQKTSAFSLAYIANYNNKTEKPFATLEEFIGTRNGYVKEILLTGHKAKYIDDPGDSGHVVPYEAVFIFSPDRSSIFSLRYTKAYFEKSGADKVLDQILSTFNFIDEANTEAKFCGGIANIPCPSGYFCKLDGSYPDAGGKCVKEL